MKTLLALLFSMLFTVSTAFASTTMVYNATPEEVQQYIIAEVAMKQPGFQVYTQTKNSLVMKRQEDNILNNFLVGGHYFTLNCTFISVGEKTKATILGQIVYLDGRVAECSPKDVDILSSFVKADIEGGYVLGYSTDKNGKISKILPGSPLEKVGAKIGDKIKDKNKFLDGSPVKVKLNGKEITLTPMFLSAEQYRAYRFGL